jgi:hypothetical protein
VYQGDDFAALVTVNNADGTPANITGYTAQAQIRADVADNEPTILITITATVTSPNVNLFIPHASTAGVAGGTYVWDLQIKDGSGLITTVVAGKAVITPEVTRP